MTGARNPILHEQSVSSSSADPERSTTHPLMEDKLTIPIDILAPSSSDRHQIPQQLLPLPSAQRTPSHIPVTISDHHSLQLLVE